MSTGGGTKAIVAAFLANLGISFAKFVAFLVTGSTAMLAEAVHSFADTGNQALLLLGGRRAARSADERHQFGYARERYFWSFVVALVLFSLGSLFAIYEGFHKIQHPEPPNSVAVAVVVLIIAIALESWSFRTALGEAKALKGKLGFATFIRQSKNPELPVVLLEDFGALAGLVIALASLVLTVKVDPVWDGRGTIAIGVLLGCIAVVLAVEMKSLLIGEGATAEDMERISAAVLGDHQVERVIHLRTQYLGPDDLMVAAKLAFPAGLTLDQVATAIDRVEAEVRTAVPSVSLIFLEPDVFRAPEP